MTKNNKIIFIIFLIITLLSYFISILLISVYYSSATYMNYMTPLTFELLWNGVQKLSFNDIKQAFTWHDYYFSATLFLSILTIILTWNSSQNKWRTIVFILFLYISNEAWIGIYMLIVIPPTLLFYPLDGEMLGEHWPSTMTMGIWGIYAIYNIISNVKYYINFYHSKYV